MRKLCSFILSLALLVSLFSGAILTTNAANSFVKASSIKVGDYIVIVSQDVSMELSAISTTSTKYGLGTEFSDSPAGLLLLEVCDGATSGTFAFKNDEKYLYWGSSNTLNLNAKLSENTSWTVSFDADGNAVICNVKDSTRQIWWNNMSTGKRFACYTGKTADNSYKTTQIYKASGSVCTHKETKYSVVTEATCEATGVGKYTCTNCGHSWTESIPLADHSYELVASNGSYSMVCTVCGDTMAADISTISEAKSYTDKNTVYTVQGIVTYISGRTVYIEDETGGLCVYFDNDADLSALALGQKICVSSTMTTYQKLPELDNPTDYILVSSDNNMPETSDITVSDILNDEDFTHLGKRVLLGDLTLGTINSAGLTNLTDPDGNIISVFRLSGYSSDIVAGNIVDVTAIISYYNDGFQLLINPGTAKEDMVKVSEGIPLVVETVPIATAKAGTDEVYYQVEGVVTCIQGRQIFIQDETGGIVVYLYKAPTSAPCAIGDKIRVLGAFGNYDGVLELQYVDHTNPEFFSILSSGNRVVAQTVTIEQLLSDSSYEYKYFAEKVFLNDVSILEIDENGSVLLWQNDSTIQIYKPSSLPEGCEVGAVVDVTATVSGYFYNYELVIADSSCIVVADGCAHNETAALNEVAPSCTEEGYTGDIYCTICGTFLEYGTTIPASHNTVFVNAVEATCNSAGYSGDAYCIDCEQTLQMGSQIAALGHDYTASVTAPSCTEEGYTSYSCVRCGERYTSNYVPATGHSYSYLESGELHSFTCKVCALNGKEEHSYANGICTLCNASAPSIEPIYDSNITFAHSLNLASDISINFAVKTSYLNEYDSFYLECTMVDYDGNEAVGTQVFIIEDSYLNGSYYYFTLTGINALQMGDDVQAVLYMMKGEQEYYSKTDVYSVATYAYRQLNNSTDENLKRMCANLLQYGAKAQLWKSYRTNALVDAAMTQAHRAYLTDLNSVTFNSNNQTIQDVANPSVTWGGKALKMETKVTVRFVMNTTNYKGNLENLSLHISFVNVNGVTENVVMTEHVVYDASRNFYSFDFDGLLASELRAVMSVAVFEGDTQVSPTLKYSVDTFGNGKTGTLGTAVQAMIAYSDSALAYFSSK